MQALSLGRSNLAQTALVFSLTLVAVALLGAVLAYWTWAWLAPRPEPRVQPAAALNGSVSAAGTLFGSAPRAQVAAPTGIAIKLLGVVAATRGRRGYAVVQLEGKQILAAHEGEDVSPGVRLTEVHPDHVILERNELREKLALPEFTSSPARPAAAQAARAAAAAAARAVQRVAPQPRDSRRRRNSDEE